MRRISHVCVDDPLVHAELSPHGAQCQHYINVQ